MRTHLASGSQGYEPSATKQLQRHSYSNTVTKTRQVDPHRNRDEAGGSGTIKANQGTAWTVASRTTQRDDDMKPMKRGGALRDSERSRAPRVIHAMADILAVLLVVALSTACGTGKAATTTTHRHSQGQTHAPNLTLPSLDGRNYALRAEVGHVLVLDFMSSWCQTCTEALPNVERLAKRWHARGVRIWVVSIDAERADLEAVLKRIPITLPVLLDRRETWFKHFKLAAVPTAVVLGRDGKLVAFVNDPPGAMRYDDAIEAVLRRIP